ncbi:hypothetical protein chiPu_0022479 [Chiloscyllium punctatum]|uniref:ribonuclease H n=1 Tax=Chiloscyllium punctatum TaxID=137246 RepID=A0A401RGU1_CHIPU|nr:hypothetical protein [Chiloscyllium punctatum]
MAYKEAQELYRNNRRQLARKLMGAPDTSQCPISREELEIKFREKLSKANNKADIKNFAGSAGHVDENLLLGPIGEEEVEEALRGIDRHSAPGPDGKKLKDLEAIQETDASRIPRLFTLWLKTRSIPESLKKSRTVLIPKCEDQDRLKNLDNWRPITIGPMLLRLFTKIMAKRLSKAVNINPRQKGFLAATPGCNENIAILKNVKGSKKNRKELAVVFVDLAKAFDSVGHKLLIGSLKRMKTPTAFVDLIRDLYTNNTTVIEGKGKPTDQIKIERGVKQGDPLSPLLFNIAIDPLISTLEQAGQGITMPYGDRMVNCTALAFTDDIALLSNSHAGMQENLKILQSYCDKTGLDINVKKTKGFHFTCKRKTFMKNHEAKWRIRNETIKYIPPGDTERYLGARIDPWAGVKEREWDEKLKTWVEGLRTAPLKPTQRLELLRVHVIPRLYFHLILTEASQNTLVKLDKII